MEEAFGAERWEDIEARAAEALSPDEYLRLKYLFRMHEALKEPVPLEAEEAIRARIRSELGLEAQPEGPLPG